jgi:hypothetical protein
VPREEEEEEEEERRKKKNDWLGTPRRRPSFILLVLYY